MPPPDAKESTVLQALKEGRLFASQTPDPHHAHALDAAHLKARVQGGDINWWLSVATSIVSDSADLVGGKEAMERAAKARNHARAHQKEYDEWRRQLVDGFLQRSNGMLRGRPKKMNVQQLPMPPPTEPECRSPGHFSKLYGPKRSNIALSPRWAQHRLMPLVSPRSMQPLSQAELNAKARERCWKLHNGGAASAEEKVAAAS